MDDIFFLRWQILFLVIDSMCAAVPLKLRRRVEEGGSQHPVDWSVGGWWLVMVVVVVVGGRVVVVVIVVVVIEGESPAVERWTMFFFRFKTVFCGARWRTGEGGQQRKKSNVFFFLFFSEGGSLGHWRYSGSGDGTRKLLFSVVAPLCAVCTSQHHNAQHRRAT